jgi:dimeric dUTPase (all-alpha-NTP-PPase superfamily)
MPDRDNFGNRKQRGKTMQLTRLLEIQHELNQHCDRQPEGDELTWAIAAELGEFAQSRKGDWCWWKRNGEGFTSVDRAIQADEIADLLCFALTSLCLKRKGASLPDAWDIGWRDSETPIGNIFQLIIVDNPLNQIYAIAQLAKACGFTQAEIESAYLAKVEENKRRWSK